MRLGDFLHMLDEQKLLERIQDVAVLLYRSQAIIDAKRESEDLWRWRMGL